MAGNGLLLKGGSFHLGMDGGDDDLIVAQEKEKYGSGPGAG